MLEMRRMIATTNAANAAERSGKTSSTAVRNRAETNYREWGLRQLTE